jgi:site-specific DNA-cytosine methylase
LCLAAGYHKQGRDNQYIVASRGRNPENPKSRESGLNTEQMLEPRYDGKTNCLTSVQKDNYVVCHNSMPRSSKTGKGGTGPLSREDGKTYCLDTGQTNVIEILGGDYRYDEGFRWRDNNKSGTLPARGRSEGNDFSGQALAKINNTIRRLTPLECERLQTVKDNYTNHVSDSQRYKMLGNGWTVDVIAHIFSYL